MISLLEACEPFSEDFAGIRISTRPDCIDSGTLELLKRFGVTSIELGAQSMVDSVLEANERGHSAEAVAEASRLIKARGFSLGLQMMTGLYGSDFEKDLYTASRFVALRPDTVRIYPTVIMKGTRLEEYFNSGDYIPYTLEQSVELCSRLIRVFEDEGIRIIRLGLHYSDSLVSGSVGGNYHPAFKELCESKIFYDSFLELFSDKDDRRVTVFINPKSLSKFYGQRKSNLKRLNEQGYEITVRFDDSLGKYSLRKG